MRANSEMLANPRAQTSCYKYSRYEEYCQAGTPGL